MLFLVKTAGLHYLVFAVGFAIAPNPMFIKSDH